MSRTLNVRAKGFVYRTLFLADPDDGYNTASVALAVLATEFCGHELCPDLRPGPNGCRRHSQSVVIGVAKLIAEGLGYGELSTRGVLFVRLSPVGVLDPLGWRSRPDWWYSRPELVDWADGLVNDG